MPQLSPACGSEFTWRAVGIGLALSVVMGAANVYFGLRVGMTVSASIPASVVGMMMLRYLFRSTDAREANLVQTAASSGESLAAGVIFTFPALLLTGAWTSFDFAVTTLAACCGGVLGVVFMMPLRRAFVDNAQLPYPEAVACASVLQSGVRSERHASRAVLIGVVGSAATRGWQQLTSWIPQVLETAVRSPAGPIYLGVDLSLAVTGVGYIIGVSVAASLFLGSALAWWVAVPLLGADGAAAVAETVAEAKATWSNEVRFLGVGMMISAGLAAMAEVAPAVAHAWRRARVERDEEIPKYVWWVLLIVAAFSTWSLYFYLLGGMAASTAALLLMLLLGFFFSAVASYIVGLVGNSNSPISGMTITAVLASALLLSLIGIEGKQAIVATLGVAAVVCCVAATSGDMSNDLKTGALVGATPKWQQVMQLGGVLTAAFVMAPTLNLLNDHLPGGIGGTYASAPQAVLFASLVEGFFGNATLPWRLIMFGVLLSLGIQLIDRTMQKRRTTFRLHTMPLALGFYLPFTLSASMLLGALVAHWRKGRGAGSPTGVLVASGFVAGESLMAILLAALLASPGLLPVGYGFTGILTLLLGWLLLRRRLRTG